MKVLQADSTNSLAWARLGQIWRALAGRRFS